MARPGQTAAGENERVTKVDSISVWVDIKGTTKMKQGIHPEYKLRTIECVCGATHLVRGTKDIKKLDICSSCHPFFTGKQKYVDTAGRVEKFKKRYAKFAESSSEKS